VTWKNFLNFQAIVEDTKGVTRLRKSKKDRQHNGQKKKNKTANNDLQNTSQKTKDRVTRILLKTGGERRCFGRVSSSCSTSGTCRVNLVTIPVISHEWGKDREVFTTSGTYSKSHDVQINHNWVNFEFLDQLCLISSQDQNDELKEFAKFSSNREVYPLHA
jgi:hypothetical protein